MSKVAGYGPGDSQATLQSRVSRALQEGKLVLIDLTDVEAKQNGMIKVILKTRQMPDFTKEVNKGAAFLDEKDPGWWRIIDTSVLDLDDETNCVLGQTWNHYARKNDLPVTDQNGFEKFKAKVWPGSHNPDAPAEHGFSVSNPVIDWINKTAKDYEISGIPRGEKYGGSLADPWTLLSATWEQLTKTWLVLIKARQNAETPEYAEMVEKFSTMTPEEIAEFVLDRK